MHFDMNNLPAVLGVTIPIVVIVGGLATAMVAIVTDYRRKRDIYEMHHKERMAAIERGMEVPPLPAQVFQDDDAATVAAIGTHLGPLIQSGARAQRSPLRRGLIWLFMGLGLFVALGVNQGPEAAAWAFVPIGMGLANLLYNFLSSRRAGGDGAAPPR